MRMTVNSKINWMNKWRIIHFKKWFEKWKKKRIVQSCTLYTFKFRNFFSNVNETISMVHFGRLLSNNMVIIKKIITNLSMWSNRKSTDFSTTFFVSLFWFRMFEISFTIRDLSFPSSHHPSATLRFYELSLSF